MPYRSTRAYTSGNLERVFESAGRIPIDDSSRIILMSDCHRGDGSWADDFLKNQYIYNAAMNHYFYKNYTYIEIGDGDELWKNKNLSDIIRVHGDTFWILSRFFSEGRLYSIFGNHDVVKNNSRFTKRFYCRNYYNYLGTQEKRDIISLDNIKHHEGLVLRHTPTGGEIFLVHGHQGDYVNYKLWRVNRFLVRYFWRPLELYGVNDPTSAAKNNEKKAALEKRLIEWASDKNRMLVTGHTHRPMFSEPGEPPYFNDGSCVHPHCITGIEVAEGEITLVKWEVKAKSDGALYVGREVLAGPRKLKEYFEYKP